MNERETGLQDQIDEGVEREEGLQDQIDVLKQEAVHKDIRTTRRLVIYLIIVAILTLLSVIFDLSVQLP